MSEKRWMPTHDRLTSCVNNAHEDDSSGDVAGVSTEGRIALYAAKAGAASLLEYLKDQGFYADVSVEMPEYLRRCFCVHEMEFDALGQEVGL